MTQFISKAYYWFCYDFLKLGKTITELTREDAKKNPLLYIILAFLLGIALVKFSKDHWWESLIWFGIGVVIGHIFW